LKKAIKLVFVIFINWLPFIPLGLAMLSLEYPWAKIGLKKSQDYFCQAAVKTDQGLSWLGRKLRR
jgi:hypothetical protein